jgi:hypothetical protein
MRRNVWILLLILSALRYPAQETQVVDLSDPTLLSTHHQTAGLPAWRKRPVRFPAQVDGVSKELLCSTIWSLDEKINQHIIMLFYSDDVFFIGTYQSAIALAGTYQVVGENRVALSSIEYRDSWIRQYIDLPVEGTALLLSEDPENLFASHKLSLPGSAVWFFPHGSAPDEGHAGKVDGFDAVKVSGRYVATRNVRFRSGPATSRPSIALPVYDEPYGIGKIDYILRGSRVSVYARTPERETIGSWSSHWYYVGIQGFETLYSGWVYGEFIAPYDEAKKKEYSAMTREEAAKIHQAQSR